MSASATVPVRFTVGSRHLAAVPRELLTVSCGLGELIQGSMAALPELPHDADGYRVLSAPVGSFGAIAAGHPGRIAGGFHAYRRHFIDMEGSFGDYLARFSPKTRSTLRRKTRRFARETGGELDIREYRDVSGIDEFLSHALPLSARTYQARLLDAGLPSDGAAQEEMRMRAAQDGVRAYLLFAGGEAVSYLYLPVDDATVRYAWLGYDDDWAKLSPGTVLQMEALERLFAEARYRWFDFTEGEGAHKAMFGTDSVECCSFLLLRRHLSNRLLLGSLAAFDGGVAMAKSVAGKAGALSQARRFLRG